SVTPPPYCASVATPGDPLPPHLTLRPAREGAVAEWAVDPAGDRSSATDPRETSRPQCRLRREGRNEQRPEGRDQGAGGGDPRVAERDVARRLRRDGPRAPRRGVLGQRPVRADD